jgi:carboxypeptidase family protein
MYITLSRRTACAFFALAILTSLVFTLSAFNASAQTSQTTVSGTVKDQNDALVAGATITLIDSRTKNERTATSNDDGFYIFANVLAGEYRLTADRTGFKKTEVQSVKVDVSIPATVNLVLEAGQISETVQTTASESQSVINTENAELSTVVTEKQINDLPLNGRNPIQLAALQAGVSTNTSVRNSNVNGMRGSYNNITWDGINIQENYLRGNQSSGLFAQAAPSVVGVSEFTITTQNASASDGTGAAQIKIVTPRGSSQFHGSLFEFWRNSALNANTFFNNAAGQPKPYLNQHQFGGNIGGPFALPRFGEGGPVLTQKNKLFFYTYYEETREAQQTLLTRTVLTAPARSGSFTYRRLDNQQLQTINVLNLTGRTIDPRINRLIGQTPLPNDLAGDRINTNGFSFNSPSGSSEKLFGYRINYDLSQKHRFDVVYSKDSVNVPNDTFNNTGEPFPGLPGKGQFPKRSRGAAAWNWAPTQTITNELRAGYYHQRSLFIGDAIEYEGNTRLAFPLGLTNPVQNSLTSGRNGKIHELMDNASWVRGNHLIRFGGNFRNVHLEPFSFAGVIPQYTIGFGTQNPNPLSSTNLAQFPGRISTTEFNNASNLLAFLSGAVSSASQTFNVTSATSGFVKGAEQRRNLIYDLYAAYISDTWRLGEPNLTLNLGLRYEYVGPVRERDGIGLLPVGGLESLTNPNVSIDLAGGGANTRPFYNPDKNNFAPNFSFSWDPFNEGKTVVRGGYSLSFVIDSIIQMAENAAIDGNQGLTSVSSPNNLSGTVSGGGLRPIDTPAFNVPRTLDDQLTLSQFPTLFTIDPDLKTPYVQQWNVGIEHEILPNTAVEVRYVGNRGVKLLRGIDINQVRIFENGFLQDFLRAQRNLELSTALNATNSAIPASPAFNPAVPGSQALTIFPRIGRRGLFTTATGNTLDSAIVNLISQGQVGELVNTYVASRNTYLTPGVNGSSINSAFFLPANFKAGAVDYIGNGSWSTYNALQAEIRRRLTHGLYFQANYTYSKAYTDFEGSDANFSALLDLGLGGVVEKKRQTNDVTHVFKANGVWELPIGPGKRLLNFDGFLGHVFSGWQMNGIFEKRSGRPISFISGRGTLNRNARSGKNTATTSLSLEDLKSSMGIFFDPVTSRPLVIDPRLIGPDGRANPEFFGHPTPGTVGTLHLTPVSGPGFWNFDFSLIKRTRISERTNVEFRAEFFNIFNHTNFFTGETQTITQTTFGQVTDTFDPRIIQFAVKFNF